MAIIAATGAIALQLIPAAMKHSEMKGAAGSNRPMATLLCEPDPPITSNAVFQEELTMHDWAMPGSDWSKLAQPIAVAGQIETAFVNRSFFPATGDMEFSVEPSIANTESFSLALSLGNSRSDRIDGYVFRFKSDPAKDGGSPDSRIELLRAGKVVSRQAFFEIPERFSIRRCGSYIVGAVNNRPILTYRDTAPLTGERIGFSTRGVEVPYENIRLLGDQFHTEFFSSAPTDWRTAGSALAEVANRSQEDPRWSYFTLSNDMRRGKNAILWNKHHYAGDVCMEFYVATRMQGERGQPYFYTRDINVTICSDGADLTKGYTFMWGGYGNSASMILRNGVEVARSENKIPTDMNFHRHWFSYKVAKVGGKLMFRVDRFFADRSHPENASTMVYEDPEPLIGDRIAIWTYDNGLVFGSVRISGDSNAYEHPDDPIGVPKFLIEEPPQK